MELGGELNPDGYDHETVVPLTVAFAPISFVLPLVSVIARTHGRPFESSGTLILPFERLVLTVPSIFVILSVIDTVAMPLSS